MKIILLLGLLLVSCGKSKQQVVENNKGQGSSSDKISSKSDTESEQEAKRECLPYDWDKSGDFSLKGIEILTLEDMKYHSDVDSVPKESVENYIQSGVCHVPAPLVGSNFDEMPKIVFLFGNHDGLDEYVELTEKIHSYMGMSSMMIERAFCFGMGSLSLINKVAEIPNIEYLIWVGHGENGNLVDWNSSDLIYPSNIKSFVSTKMKVSMISCQAGQKEKEWKQVFGEQSQIDISQGNIPVTEGLDFLMDKTRDEIEQCRHIVL